MRNLPERGFLEASRAEGKAAWLNGEAKCDIPTHLPGESTRIDDNGLGSSPQFVLFDRNGDVAFCAAHRHTLDNKIDVGALA